MVFVSEPASFSLLQKYAGTRTWYVCSNEQPLLFKLRICHPNSLQSRTVTHSTNFLCSLLLSSKWSSPAWLTRCTMSQSAVVLCLDSPILVGHHYSPPSIIFNKGTRFSQISSTVSSTYLSKFVSFFYNQFSPWTHHILKLKPVFMQL
jgi:hypothetical protein